MRAEKLRTVARRSKQALVLATSAITGGSGEITGSGPPAVGTWQRGVFIRNSNPVEISNSDPYVENVSLLLHCDGVNNSKIIRDSSLTPKLMSVGGSAALTTTTKKFGSAGLLVPNGASFVSTPSVVDFDVRDENFTIECYAQLNTLGSDSNMVAKWLNGGDSFIFGTSGTTLRFIYIVGGTQFTLSAPNVVTAGVMTHFAVDRNNTTLRLFANGSVVQTGSISGAINYSALSNLFVGFGTTTNLVLDEVRFTVGVSRYNAAFTPQTSAFVEKNSPYIVLGWICVSSGTPGTWREARVSTTS